MRLLSVSLLSTLVLGLVGPALAAPAGAEVPGLRVQPILRGLDHPWDVQPLGKRLILVTERDRARLTVRGPRGSHTVRLVGERVWVSGETGLMSLQVDPRFQENRRIYTCQGGFTSGGGHDVRVVAWRLNKNLTRAVKAKVLLRGLPASSGRHGGCRLLITKRGSLLVGTGDAAQGSNPENLRSLGGKTLQLRRGTGAPWPTNPFIRSSIPAKRYLHTYGHRNVQGLAQRANGSLWSIEQGTYRDDEVNRLVSGGDYGYNPVPGYNESVPMTDGSLPGRQIAARWRSGDPTVATSGGTFVAGRKWGALRGTLAVGVLKDQRVLFLRFDGAGKLQKVRAPAALQRLGRIRSITRAPGGSLLVTTDNGGGRDAVYRVSPR